MVDERFSEPLRNVMDQRNGFGHRQHVMLAWRYLVTTDQQTAQHWMRLAIRHVASAHGTPDRYHETLTTAWTQIVAAHNPGRVRETYDEFVSRCPDLLDKHLPERHFSPGVLYSPAARDHWVDPDLVPLPSSALS